MIPHKASDYNVELLLLKGLLRFSSIAHCYIMKQYNWKMHTVTRTRCYCMLSVLESLTPPRAHTDRRGSGARAERHTQARSAREDSTR